MLAAGLNGALGNFRIDLTRLDATAGIVAEVIRANYPSLAVPLHARWRHFKFGTRDLWGEIAQRTAWRDAAVRARAEFDLAIVSVLLDAGADPRWRYRDAETGIVIGRSEGLALASLRMFAAGLFSDNPDDPLRADARRLASLTVADLAQGFGAGPDNPFPNLEGRAALLARLGDVIAANGAVFADAGNARPGGLFDKLVAPGEPLAAPDALHEVLLHLGPIWLDRLTLGELPLGDTWRHPAIVRHDGTNGLMPLHKLAQWLTYSLIEPLQRAGVAVTDIDGLTGLAEYRNGGLFIDSGVLSLADPAQAERPHAVDSTLVVEWRALTVGLLDRLLPAVRERLGVSPASFPLGAMLEGGTWAAGRKLAAERRAGGGPPLTVVSDGTVF